MSNARVFSRASLGLTAPLVTVEVHLSNGLPAMNMVGLPETTVRQSRERVRSAILNAGLQFPARRITVNLAPAALPKSGGRYDLAIALGILAASAQIPADAVAACEVLGELALSGELRPVDSLLPALVAARDSGHRLLLPAPDHALACQLPGLDAWSVHSLAALCQALRQGFALRCTAADDARALQGLAGVQRCRHQPAEAAQDEAGVAALWQQLQHIRGQQAARHALLVAAAGGHNLLLLGAPGTGKTRLAQLLAALLPPLQEAAALEVAAIHAVAGEARAVGSRRAPWRAPHHSVTPAALIGGGRACVPGEVSLAHHGVLFMDELGEFPRVALDSLRQPLESGQVNLSRVDQRLHYPARFQWLAASNPCPCGYLGSDTRCACSAAQLRRYLDKLSGPLLDRHDLSIELLRPSAQQLLDDQDARHPVSLNALREQVQACRTRQLQRAGRLNAQLDDDALLRDAVCDAAATRLLQQLAEAEQLSARATLRVLRIARTMADLEGALRIAEHHLAAVMACRQLGRVQARLRQALQSTLPAPVR